MKRPLVLVGLCYLLTLAAAVFFGEQGSFVLLWVCLAGFAVTFVYWRTRRAVLFPVAFLTAAVALGSFCIYSNFAVQPPRTLDGKDEIVEGTVCELPTRQNDRWYYVLQVDSAADKKAPQHFKIRLSAKNGLSVQPYSHIKGKIHLFLPSGGEGYSSRGYYASKGIMMFAYLNEYSGVAISPPTEKPPYYYALRLRQKLLQSVSSMFPQEEASLVNGILLGDTSGLSGTLTADFRTDGISHILSVSGLHMATIAELLIFLLLFLHVPKKASAAAAAVGVFGFMAVTCFVPSVTRSGVMCLLCLAAPLVSRRADPLNSLCTAGLLICLTNPYAAADVGLLLSFFATMGLILCTGPITKFLNEKLDKVRALSPLVRGINGVLATSVGATLFTLPIILLSFGTVSIVAPLSNLLELVPSTLLMGFGAAAAVINLLLPQTYLAMPFALVAGLLAKYMQNCSAWLAQLPFASVSASRGFVLLWLSGTLFLFAAALALAKGRRLFPQTACISLIILLVGIFSYQITQQKITRVAVLDVGTDVSVVLTRGDHAAVIGCGSYNSNKIISYLNGENAAQLDCMELLTQEHDEYVSSSDLAARFRPKRLIMQHDSAVDGFVQKAAACSAKLTKFQSKAETTLWSNVKIQTLMGKKAAAAKLTVEGISVVICPNGAGLSELPADWKNTDFLITDAAVDKSSEPEPVCTVFSMDQEDLQKSAGKVKERRCVWTGGYGNLVLELKGERTLSIRRET